MAQEKEKKAEEQNENVEKTSETSDASDKKEEKTDAKPEEGKSEEKELSPEEKIAELEKQVEDLKSQALYKAAENDNWRKRMMQQKDEAVAYANASLLGDLLDSLDNFDVFCGVFLVSCVCRYSKHYVWFVQILRWREFFAVDFECNINGVW